jgi:hypothetical protein
MRRLSIKLTALDPWPLRAVLGGIDGRGQGTYENQRERRPEREEDPPVQ